MTPALARSTPASPSGFAGLAPLPLLTAVNFFNYLDRQVVYSMTPSLAQSFSLSRFELGWLSFVNLLVFALASLISGPIADRVGPRRVIFTGILLWSAATIGSALAPTFSRLLLFRALVGLGEGAYGPSAIVLLCAAARPDQRGRALGIYNAGMALGGSTGLFLGAVLAPMIGWRGVFWIAGGPSLILAVLAAFVAAPRRLPRPHARPAGVHLRNPTFILTVAGGVLVTFAAAGLLFWARTLIIDERGFSVVGGSVLMLFIGLGCGMGGVIAGGYLGDSMGRKHHAGHAKLIGISLLMAAPLGVGCLLAENKAAFALLTAGSVFLLSMYNGPVAVVVDHLSPPQYAATLQAVFLFCVHVLGDAPGASVVGLFGGHGSIARGLFLSVGAYAVAGVLFLLVARRLRRHAPL